MSEKFIAHFREREPKEQSLEDHLIGVSKLASKFASKIELSACGELVGLLHDLGKYSAEFQAYLRSAVGLLNQDEDEDWVDAVQKKGRVDHSTAGAQYIWHAMGSKGGMHACVAQVLSLCIASHHSGLIDCMDPSGFDLFSRRVGKVRQKTHIDEVSAAMDRPIRDRSERLLSSQAIESEIRSLISGIHSKNEKFGAVLQCQIGLAVRFLFSCLVDADRINTADFEHQGRKRFRQGGDYEPWATLVGRLETHLDAIRVTHPIDNLRQDISMHCLKAAQRPKGAAYTLTVPTGGGKTLASLRFALHHAKRHDLDRIIFIIPFTSIIDQNARVVRSILDPASADGKSRVVLEHHSSVTPEQQTWREKMLCENWDAPIVYTTMVQLLEALFGAGTRGARRMHQLANAVLVFDEIQTLPVKCIHIFNNAINFLSSNCGSTVVLCSATQPLLHKVAADKGALKLSEAHEIMPDVQRLFDDLKRVEVKDSRKSGGWSYSEMANLAMLELARTKSVLVIVNTKDSAKKIFDACTVEQADALVHLSTDMCPAHRKKKLETVRTNLEKGLPMLCISTQLIEAGVDIDFRVVIRCLAGLDSIAQAAGRCNRNGSPHLGIVHVLNPSEENLGRLEDISVGREKAEAVLDDFKANPARYRNNLFGQEALGDYYNYYFFERQKEMAYKVSAKDIGHDDTLLGLLSHNEAAVSEADRQGSLVKDRLLYQSFMSAARLFNTIDTSAQAVVVPYGKEGKDVVGRLHGVFDIEVEFDLLRQAQQFSVNVFPHVLEKLKTVGAVTEVKPETRILTLDPRYYSDQFGISTEPVSLMETYDA